MASQSVTKLTPRHYKILDYCIAGLTAKQIAKELSMTPAHVSIIVNSPSFQHQFALRRSALEDVQLEHEASHIDDVKNTLQEGAIAAAQKLVGSISSKNEGIALKSATEILDRTGYPKELKSSGESSGTTVIINNADFKILKTSLQMLENKESQSSSSVEIEPADIIQSG